MFWPWRDFRGARWGHPENNWRRLSLLAGEQPEFPCHGCWGPGWSWAAPLLSGSLVGTQREQLAGEQLWWESRERGMESKAAPSQGKDPSDHLDSLLTAANRFFCPHGLVLVTLTEGGWGVWSEESTWFRRLDVEKEEWRSCQDLVTDSWVCLSRNCSCDGSARDDGEGHLRRDNSNWQFWQWVRKDW